MLAVNLEVVDLSLYVSVEASIRQEVGTATRGTLRLAARHDASATLATNMMTAVAQERLCE